MQTDSQHRNHSSHDIVNFIKDLVNHSCSYSAFCKDFAGLGKFLFSFIMSNKQEPDTVTGDLTEVQPVYVYTDVDIKIENEESFPEVKTESFFQEKGLVSPNTSLSQGQWSESTNSNADVEDQIGTFNVSSSHGGNMYSDLRQEIQTSAIPNTLSTNSNLKDTQCEAEDIKDVKDDVFSNQEDQVKLYKCGTCPYSSNHLFDLYQHNICHTNSYKCDLCQSSYQDLLDLKSHLGSHAVTNEILCGSRQKRKHAGEKPFCCDLYGYTCSTLSTFICHKRTHTGEKPYSCDLCDYKCALPFNLEQHRRIHTGEKPFSCDICDYTCSQSSALKIHKRKHTGEKPYSCDICDYTCTQSGHLIIHKRKHTGERPFACDQCNYTCSDSSSLKPHKRIHTGEKPFSCDLCDYKSARSSSLKAHKRKHTDKKPLPVYSCDLCDYTCALSSNLKIHQRTHTGEKLYSCDFCDYICLYPSNLKRHKRTHHIKMVSNKKKKKAMLLQANLLGRLRKMLQERQKTE